jgi:hypothetical protein
VPAHVRELLHRLGHEREGDHDPDGHTSVDVTFDRYGHLLPEAQAEAADRLNAYLRGTASVS